MTGVLLVDKPEGATSADVIRRLKRRLGRRTKIGHAGTLDPFASGLLPLCLGEATKVVRFLSGDHKAYEGTIRLGIETDTLDPTGRTVGEAPVPSISVENLAQVAARLTGRSEQQPPMYSAVKQGGVPLYRLARRGQEVTRAPRPVEILALELVPTGPAEVGVRVRCSKGTYVRVLAADVARALGTVGHLAALRRLEVGPLKVENSVPLAELEQLPDEAPLPLLGIRQALASLAARAIRDEEVARLQRGQQWPLERLAPGEAGECALLVRWGAPSEVVGVIEVGPGGGWRIDRLLRATSDPLQG